MPVLRFRRRRVLGSSRGQGLAEFAIVFPVLMIIIGGIIQFGIIFWGQNTLTQVARDTGRWAASQTVCPTTGSVQTTADSIATNSSLIGYPASGIGLVVTTSGTCPPTSNQQVGYVTITLTHQVPVFFPWIPGNGNLSTSAQFRLEPAP
ncbi:MAG TPA: TadE family protein [Candidatus Limnocylindrales bacterium]|nr:TadE family protein [Candidatus Limnocylindrales bacterium]